MTRRDPWAGILSGPVDGPAKLPLLVARKAGLVVEMTDGAGAGYRGSLFYDAAKASVIRLASAQAEELRRHGVAAVAVTPGFLRSEAVLDHFGVTETTWRHGVAKDPNFAASETPGFSGSGGGRPSPPAPTCWPRAGEHSPAWTWPPRTA